MRSCLKLLCSLAVLSSASAAQAADALKFGEPPEWVTPAAIPETSNTLPDAPIAILLADQQIALEPGKTTIFNEVVMKIQTSQGLAAGNISIPWNPATDTVTVHKLRIRRGGQQIDVLQSGQTFTTMRRESNLELATLDGQLTANIQPEGLQVGDIIDFGMTVEHEDPVMKGHAEALFGAWNGTPVKSARARLLWPRDFALKARVRGDLSLPKPVISDGRNQIQLTASDLQPLTLPRGAPPRFAIGRAGRKRDGRRAGSEEIA